MLLIQNKRVNWETYQIGIPGATAKDKENRRIPFNPKGRLAAILETVAAEVRADGTCEHRSALETLVRLHVRLAFEERALIVVYISEERNLPEAERRRVRRFQRAYVEGWADLLRPLRPDLSDDERRAAAHAAIGLLNSTGYRRQVGLPRARAEDLLARMALVALLEK